MKYDYQFRVTEGSVIHIGGHPYRHLGNGVFGGNTAPELAMPKECLQNPATVDADGVMVIDFTPDCPEKINNPAQPQRGETRAGMEARLGAL